ncbi:hypothetical protein ACIQF6_17440 [Kitasatospora sp. NPDC092948]|uniref:hypothetical protein n=1 Tax=Kitasatospora sp. NPDC092948 TaxID=3364088 RepID=UPI0037F1F5F2
MTEERRPHWWQRRTAAEPVPAEGPGAAFDVAWRGYDRQQVDAHLALPPDQRPRPAGFDIVRRGYERTQVDRVLREQE